MLRHKLLFLAALSLLPVQAHAAMTATIQTSIGPNPIDADSATYRAGALYDIENGLQGSSSKGIPQEYFVSGPTVTPGDLVSSGTPTESGFISWDGDTDVADNYDQQHGNGIYFGLHLTSSTTFTLADLSLTVSSTDSGHAFDLGPVAYTGYTSWIIGIEPAGGLASSVTDPVDEIDYAGTFLALDASTIGLPAVMDYIDSNAPFNITATYSLDGTPVVSDTVTVSSTSVPEPATAPMLAIAALVLLKNRRRLQL